MEHPDSGGKKMISVRHPLFEMAEQSAVFVLNGSVYLATKKEVKRGDFYRTGATKKLALSEPVALRSLDDLFYKRAETEIEQTEKRIAQEKLDDMDITKIKYSQLPQIPRLIHEQVFPHLRQTDSKVSALLNHRDSPKKARRQLGIEEEIKRISTGAYEEIRKDIEKIKREILNAERRSKIEEKLDALLTGISYQDNLTASPMIKLSENGLALINPDYYLLPKDTLLKRARLRIGEGVYAFSKRDTVKELEDEFNDRFLKKVTLSGLEKISREDIEKAVALRLDDRVFDPNNHNEQDFGFIKNGDNYLVYLKVPKFVVKSQFTDQYYLFRETRVAINVSLNNGKLNYEDNVPELLELNYHPLIRYNSPRFCLGGNSLPRCGKDTGEVIAKRLLKSRDILMHGWITRPHSDGEYCQMLRSCVKHGIDHYSSNIISESQAKSLASQGVAMVETGGRN